jgi:hypothetical protein
MYIDEEDPKHGETQHGEEVKEEEDEDDTQPSSKAHCSELLHTNFTMV